MEQNTSSRLLYTAGGLLAVAGVLLAVCLNIWTGALCWVAAALLLVAAGHFRQAERNEQERREKEKREQREGADKT